MGNSMEPSFPSEDLKKYLKYFIFLHETWCDNERFEKS